MIIQGHLVPNYEQMGTDILPAGNRNESPYGLAEPTSQAPTDSVFTMGAPTDSAESNIGYRPTSGPPGRYRPEAGRADRLGANIVGMTFDDMASGGYSGGATQRI